MKLIKKFFTREVLLYIIMGILTTAVNFIFYFLLCNIIGIQNLISNAIAWIVSVLFAYITNNRYVFLSYTGERKKELTKIIKFFGARLFSFLIEEAGMFIFIDILSMNNLVIKVFMNVIVIVLNYVFSKLYIFK